MIKGREEGEKNGSEVGGRRGGWEGERVVVKGGKREGAKSRDGKERRREGGREE